MPKLIVLRGNSGSGKSSVAKEIQTRVFPHPVLIEHDHIRRKLLKEREGADVINPELIYRIAKYAVENDRDVILEGILRIDSYKELFDKLIILFPDSYYFYYFHIPFEETVERHSTKVDVDFGEEKMRLWYKEHDETGYRGEVIIPTTNLLEMTVQQVINETGLGE